MHQYIVKCFLTAAEKKESCDLLHGYPPRRPLKALISVEGCVTFHACQVGN